MYKCEECVYLAGRLVNPQNLECLWLIDDIQPGRVAIALKATEQRGLTGVVDFAWR